MDYKSGLRRNIKLYYLHHFLEGLLFTIPVWYVYQKLYLSIEQISFIYAVYSLLILIFEMPTGAFADLFGRKASMFLGWFLSGVAAVAIGLSSEYWQFLATFGLYSFGTSLVSGANYALLYDSMKELGTEDEFSKQIAGYGLPMRISMMGAAFAGGWLFSISAGLPFILQGVAFLVLAISMLLLTEPKIDSEKFTLRNYYRQTRDGFKELGKNNYTLVLSLYYFICSGLSWSILTYFRLPLAYSFNFSEQEVSIFLGVGYIATIFIMIFAARLKKIFTARVIFILTPILLLIITLPSTITPKILIPLILILIQVAGSARFTFLDSYTNKEFSSRYRATALSSLNMLVSLLYFALVLVSGPIISKTSVETFFSGLGAVTLVVTLPLTIMLLRSYDKHHK